MDVYRVFVLMDVFCCFDQIEVIGESCARVSANRCSHSCEGFLNVILFHPEDKAHPS